MASIKYNNVQYQLMSPSRWSHAVDSKCLSVTNWNLHNNTCQILYKCKRLWMKWHIFWLLTAMQCPTFNDQITLPVGPPPPHVGSARRSVETVTVFFLLDNWIDMYCTSLSRIWIFYKQGFLQSVLTMGFKPNIPHSCDEFSLNCYIYPQ